LVYGKVLFLALKMSLVVVVSKIDNRLDIQQRHRQFKVDQNPFLKLNSERQRN